MISISDKPGRTATVDGREYLFFSGFSYLGMTASPEMQQCLEEGAARYGVVFPSSRIGNIRLDLFEEFEEVLSRHTGLPASVSYSSGYQAAQAAAIFAASGRRTVYLPQAHPSLRLPGYPPGTSEETGLISRIIDLINNAGDDEYVIIGDAVNPLLGKVEDFSWLSHIRKKTRVLVDDSHGMGILSEGGEGIISLLPRVEHIEYILCYSLAKAMGIGGGVVSGSKAVITALKSMPHFTAGTAISPANAYAYTRMKDHYRERRRKLMDNIGYLRSRDGISAVFENDERLPIFFSRSEKLYGRCFGEHILLSAFSYPSEKDPPVTRAVISSLHTPADLDRLAACAVNGKL